MIKIQKLEEKRLIEIDTPYLLFIAIVGQGGEIKIEKSEIREPEDLQNNFKNKEKKRKDCGCGRRK